MLTQGNLRRLTFCCFRYEDSNKSIKIKESFVPDGATGADWLRASGGSEAVHPASPLKAFCSFSRAHRFCFPGYQWVYIVPSLRLCSPCKCDPEIEKCEKILFNAESFHIVLGKRRNAVVENKSKFARSISLSFISQIILKRQPYLVYNKEVGNLLSIG